MFTYLPSNRFSENEFHESFAAKFNVNIGNSYSFDEWCPMCDKIIGYIFCTSFLYSLRNGRILLRIVLISRTSSLSDVN